MKPRIKFSPALFSEIKTLMDIGEDDGQKRSIADCLQLLWQEGDIHESGWRIEHYLQYRVELKKIGIACGLFCVVEDKGEKVFKYEKQIYGYAQGMTSFYSLESLFDKELHFYV